MTGFRLAVGDGNFVIDWKTTPKEDLKNHLIRLEAADTKDNEARPMRWTPKAGQVVKL